MVETPDDAVSMQPTQTFGPYALYKRLAVGGMAEIFLAKHTQDTENRWFALKIMLPHNAGNAEHESMFMDEARLLQRIRHPNIVAAMDLLSIDNRVAVALEYVPGNDLSVMLKKMREANLQAPIDLAIDLTMAIAAGLHHAHTLVGEDGNPLYLVHRDVTPENILLGVDGSVKIADFGVAKARGFGQVETKTGIIKGKLRYMAPEYATGNMQDVRSDIFSLGLCLFELLTSRPAYNDDSPGPALVEAIKHATIPPVTSLRPDCPPILERLLFKALAVNPQDRFTTAEGMRRGLERIRASVPDSGMTLGQWLTQLGIGPAIPQATPASRPALQPASQQKNTPEPTRLPTDKAIALEPTGQMEVAAAPPLRVRRPDIFTQTGFNRIVEREVKHEPRVAAVVEHQHPSKMSGLIDLNAFVEVEPLEPVPLDHDDEDDLDDADVETNRLAVHQGDFDRFQTTEPQPVLHDNTDVLGATQPQPVLQDAPSPGPSPAPYVPQAPHDIDDYAAAPTQSETALPSSPRNQAVSLFDDDGFVPPAHSASGAHAQSGAQVDNPVAFMPTLAHPPVQHVPTQPTPVQPAPVQPTPIQSRPVQTTPAPMLAPTHTGTFAQRLAPSPTTANPFGQPGFSQPGFNLHAPNLNQATPTTPQAPGQPIAHQPALPQTQPPAVQPVQSIPSTGIPQPTQRGIAQPKAQPSELFLKLGIVGVLILVLLVVLALAIAFT